MKASKPNTCDSACILNRWIWCLVLPFLMMGSYLNAQDSTIECPPGGTVGCETEATPGMATFTARDVIQLVSDDDIFYGTMDTESYSDNTPLVFEDPGVPAGTTITGVQLRLFFRIEGNSCEEDIDIRVTDPFGNVTEFISPIAGCAGNDNNALYSITEMFSAAGLGGGMGDWVIEMRDSDDQNPISAGTPGNSAPPGTEYSVRFGDVQYLTERVEQVPFLASGPIITNGLPNCAGTDYTYVYEATAPNGDVLSCEQTFTLSANGPNITVCAPDVEVSSSSEVVANLGAIQYETDCVGGDVEAGDALADLANSPSGEETGDAYTINYTVTDECGETAVCTQTFVVVAVPPDITNCAPNIEVSCFADIAPQPGEVEFTTTCPAGAEVIVGNIIADPGNSACGESTSDIYTIEYTVEDFCGESASCIQTFTIVSSGPTITNCAPDVEISCSDEAAADISLIEFTTECGLNATVTASGVGSATGNTACGESPGDQYQVSYTVTDDCGRIAICTQIFTIVNPEPMITNCTSDTEVECSGDIVADISMIEYTSCGAAVVTAGNIVGDIGNSACGESPGDIYTIEYTVTDNCGFTASCTQTFTINNAAPTLSCPANETVVCAADIVAGTPSITTSCGLGSDVSSVGPTLVSGDADCAGAVYEIEYRVTDDCGRTASCVQTFTIDNAAPTLSCPADETVGCAADIVAGTPSITTSCGLGSDVSSVGPTLVSGDADCAGAVYEIEYRVTDDCGRTASCVQTFTIDNAAPTLSCPANETVGCAADIVAGTPSVTTSCGLGSDVSSVGPTLVSGDADCAGAVYEIEYRVTDDCGRTASCVQTFTIDNAAPTLSCPADETVGCAADIVAGTPSVTTSCGLGSDVSSVGPTLVSGDADCVGAVYEIEYRVTDDCGRTASCVQTFTIDNAAPTLSCPADETVGCAADIVAGTPSVTTSCGLGSEVSSVGPTLVSGDADCVGAVYEIEYRVTDDCGRTASCVQTFTIDNAAPTLSCPANETVGCAADIVAGTPSVTTSCGLGSDFSSVGPTLVSGDADCAGAVYEIEYRVTDDCGRTASCTQTFTIDNAAPTITCPEDCPVACASDIRPGTPEFTTSCVLGGTLSLTGPIVDGDPGCDGTTYTYTHFVTDDCGRTASCQQVFTIVNECHLIDFDFDDEGNPLAPSLEIFDQYQDFTVTTDNPHRCVQLFDTGNPTSNDFDLGTPNEQYGGPGIGAGGDNNTEFQGNALIVSKDCGVPNETEGQLIFTFDCSVTIKTVDLLDMKCGESEIELYDEHHNLIEYLDIPAYGVNSFNTFDVFVSGVYTMIIDLDCGGGVTAFKYCKDNAPGTDCEAPDLCENYNLDFDDNGYHWMTNSTSGSFDVGDQNYTINIIDDDNILEDTYESGGGLLVGIDPHDVDDELVVCYNLSQVSDNVSFDIHDLDYKNYTSSKQQEAVCVYGLLGDDPTQILPTVSSLDGHVDVDGNCAEATTDSAQSHDDESVLVEFDECIDKVVIVYGTGSNSPTDNPSYSKITIGKRLGFNSEVCPGDCVDCTDGVTGGGDDDGDGVCNIDDVCPGGNDNIDSDGDGIPDDCDDICYDYNIDHGDCGAGWQHDDESGSVESGLENISIDILDDDNILEDTEADGTGLLVGIDPHTVDDELIVCYTLSESSSNVVFDIVDLDYKNSGSKQQEAVCIYGTLGNNPTQILPTVSSLDGHVDVDGNCAEGTVNSAHSHDDESILVEFTECIDKITIVYGTGSNSPTQDPSYSKITIGESIFSVEQCKGGCDEPCPIVGSGGGDGDADDDGVCDGDDICPGGDDFMDTDGDGTPDFCDTDCTAGSSPVGDDDGDFVCNDVDQCPGFDDNIDENNNGIPDACDVECEDYTLDFTEPGIDWSGHSLMDSYTVGEQTFDVRIIDGDHILTSSHDRESGLAIGTEPHDVDDEVVICYSLSEVASNVRFDIVDLDYKNGGSRQQEAVCVYGTLGNDPTQIMPMITSLDGNVAINGNCAEATANSSVSGQDESILVEFTECIDKVTIVYGTGSNSPTSNPDHGKITIGQDIGFVTEVCTNTCPEPRIEDEENAHVSLYPNPVYGSSNVTIEIDTEARGDAQVILIDALGRTVSSENIQLVNDLTIHQFSTNRLAAGVYFVQLHTQEWRTDGLKLVVVKP